MLGVENHGAGRDGNQQVVGRPAVAAGAAAGLAALGLPLGAMGQRGEAIDPLLGDENHAPPITPVAAVGPAARDEFLAAETDRPVPSFARFHSDFRFVDEHNTKYNPRLPPSPTSFCVANGRPPRPARRPAGESWCRARGRSETCRPRAAGRVQTCRLRSPKQVQTWRHYTRGLPTHRRASRARRHRPGRKSDHRNRPLWL